MKTVLKKSMIASAVALALVACQNVERDKTAKQQDEQKIPTVKVVKAEPKKENTNLEELLRQVRELETINHQINAQREAEFRASPSLQTREEFEADLVVVTGSRLKRADVSSVSPVTIIDREAFSAYPQINENRENFKQFDDNGVFVTAENPVSTFSIDVDTASYTNVRRMLNDGYLPPEDSVRLEEFINYFNYDFTASSSQQAPFSVNTESMQAPWNKDAYLIQIGIKGYEPEEKPLPPSNLVFLVDVSGSMQSPNKLGLVKKSLKLLTQQLSEKDKVSLVVYAGASGVVLEPTSGKDKLKIEQALDQLTAGGSTNGASGIQLAYQMAQKAFIQDGINRVILATDGDFNVGMTKHEQLMELIESKRNSNIFFSSLGFGSGNYNDHLMEQLANKGNGNAAYIDSLQEAKKVLVDERAGTLMTIAKDVKIQVEFNPTIVSEYRLLGYENRILNREDFNNDKVDAGEIGAGHTVTALYEVILNNSEGKRIDPLRYSVNSDAMDTTNRRLAIEAAMVKLRYKLPVQDKSRLIEKPIYAAAIINGKPSENIKFAASAAGFAQLLRGGRYLEDWSWPQAIASAKQARGDDNDGYRVEMIKLMEMAQLLSNEQTLNRVGMLESPQD